MIVFEINLYSFNLSQILFDDQFYIHFRNKTKTKPDENVDVLRYILSFPPEIKIGRGKNSFIAQTCPHKEFTMGFSKI